MDEVKHLFGMHLAAAENTVFQPLIQCASYQGNYMVTRVTLCKLKAAWQFNEDLSR